MEAKKLYNHLENDFIKTRYSDDWARYMEEIQDYLSENSRKDQWAGV
jgi:hypothetical protein